MSARWRDEAPEPAAPDERTLCLPMSTLQIDQVLAIENAAYAFPWTRGNFIDSIAAGYTAQVLVDADARMLGYMIAMDGVDEMHLLNITVAPKVQGRGHARRMLAALVALCRERAAGKLWLEVRAGNLRARSIYARLGFTEVGLRKAYYPAGFGRREDAIVMSLAIAATDESDAHGLE